MTKKKHSVGWAIWVLRKAGFRRAAALLVNRSHRNPAPIDPAHPKAPKPSPPTGTHPPPYPNPQDPLARKIVAYANLSLHFAGRMTYTQTRARSQLFHRKPGVYLNASADCSQLVASILHWLGVKVVTDTDYTGTLLAKGTLQSHPTMGCVAIWGPGTGIHAAFVTEHIKGTSDWYTVGFGHQGAPNRAKLSDMNAYFLHIGKPGVRYLTFG